MNETSNMMPERKLNLVRKYDPSEDGVYRIVPPKVWLNNNEEGQVLTGLEVYEDADTHELVVRKVITINQAANGDTK